MKKLRLYEPIIPANPLPEQTTLSEEVRNKGNLNVIFPIERDLDKSCDMPKIFKYVFDENFIEKHAVRFKIYFNETDGQGNVLLIQLNGCLFAVAAVIIATMVDILLMCDKYMHNKSQIVIGSTFFFIKQDFENRIKQLC